MIDLPAVAEPGCPEPASAVAMAATLANRCARRVPAGDVLDATGFMNTRNARPASQRRAAPRVTA